MNIQDKTIELLLEARSHSTAKIDGVENQKYGRSNTDIPDVLIAAQDVWQHYVDDVYYVNSDIGVLCGLGYNIAEDVDGFQNCTLGDLRNGKVYGDNKGGAYLLLMSFAEANGDLTSNDRPIKELLYEEDIANYVTDDINNILAEKKIPIKLTVDYTFYEGLEITDVEYTAYDSVVDEFIQKIGPDKLVDLMSHEGNIPVNRYNNRDALKNRDSLSRNQMHHRSILRNNEKLAKLDKEAGKLKSQLAKTKNYNKASRIQSDLDDLETEIDYTNELRNSAIEDIKDTMKNKPDDVK